MATKKILHLARSCKELFAIVDTEYRREFPEVGSSRVTNSTLFGFVFDVMQPLFGVINWPKVARATVFDPAEVDCPDIRYTSSLTLPTALYSAATWEALEQFRAARKADFVGIRRNVYLPFCVKLILTAYVLALREQLPVSVVSNSGADDILIGLGTVPAGADVLDPEIFEALYPNGTNAPVDADSYDATELF